MERASVVDSIGTPVDLACDRETLDHDERAIHADLLRRLSQHRQATTELVDGYAFTFPPRSELLADLAAWVALERRCCPFLRFAISIDAASTVLELSGGRGAKEFIRLEFTSGHPIDVSSSLVHETDSSRHPSDV